MVRALTGTMLVLLALTLPAGAARAAGSKILPGHVPPILTRLSAFGSLPSSNHLNLAIGLPLRKAPELAAFLDRLYDPASPDYRHYLTPDQFTEQFGPTPEDYQAVTAFARQNNLLVSRTHGNRLVLDVNGSVADIQRAFHVTLKVYHHPTEARDFYAPDAEPSVEANLPVADISGLDNLCPPQPKSLRHIDPAARTQVAPRTGSGPAGTFWGNDFRAAYLPGVALTGTGQNLGLVEFSGYYASDITAYESKAGLPAVPLQNVSVDNDPGAPTKNGDIEVSTDIEMAIAMAPGLAKIYVFDAGPYGSQYDVLEAMVASNNISQFSCSWGWAGGPTNTIDGIFEEMMAQGQSFFSAAGDSDAFTLGATSANGVDNPSLLNAPASSPYITQVGGTSLSTTGPGGTWSGETVWNWGFDNGSYVGTSGGISSYYAIPAWQASVSMSANGGSASFRNIPDVAANADNVYITYNNGGSTTNEGGTSCAAPLWAALAALINEQAKAAGRPAIGFINPAIYTLGRSAGYAASFHDITTGDNTSGDSPGNYHAVAGYDLCTGWGTPAGQNLINAIAGFEALTLSPTNGFSTTGYVGSPFNTNSAVLTLNNIGYGTLKWAVGGLPAWLTATPASGTLSAQAGTTTTLGLNAAASALAAGTYASSITITDVTSGVSQRLSFSLQTFDPLAILPANGLSASGQVGGPFAMNATHLTLTNQGNVSLNWNLGAHPSWLVVTPTNGMAAAGRASVVTATLNSSVRTLPGAVYAGVLPVNDLLGQTTQNVPVVLEVGQSIVQNGGFEAGTFTNWTLVGNTVNGGATYNSVEPESSYPTVVHSGNYGTFLGDLTPATLAQTLVTVPGQTYLLSFWLSNPSAGAGEQFQVNWITNATTAGQIYYVTNPPVLAWTNFTYVLAATGTNTVLQFGAQNVPNYFGLDDVSVTPIPNPAISQLARSGNTLNLTLYTVAGINYRLLYATNLAQAVWLSLGTNTAATNTLTLTNNPGTDRQRFYRVQQLP